MTVRESFMSMFKLTDPNGKFEPVKLCSYYYVLGHLLRKYPLSIGTSEIDMRYSFGVCVDSGFGKQSIYNTINEIGEYLDLDCSSYTSLHPEQLVGKRWKNKDGEEKTVYGYLYSDFLMKDDALSLLNGKDKSYAESRDHLLACGKIYGKNWINKRLVEQSKAEGLSYLGIASFVYFIQPNEKIVEKNLSSGFFRRYPISKVNLTIAEKLEMDEKRLTEKYKPKPEEYMNFVRIIRIIRISSYIEPKTEYISMITNKNKEYIKNNKYKLLDNIFTSNTNNIIKFAYMNALLRWYTTYNPTKPTNPKERIDVELELIKEDVEQAIKDYDIIYSSIKDFVVGNDESEIIHEVDREIIMLLVSKRCLSKETSSISSSEVINAVSKKLKIHYNTVSGRFYKMKGKEIESKQHGTNSSRVWVI